MPVGDEVQLAKDQSSSFYKYAPDLFNGNIRNMKVAIKQLGSPMGYTYGYDQLNRITKMDAWTDNATMSKKYLERVSYDPNGNIKTYLRHNDEGKPMDRLRYNYASDNNKLRHINDTVPDNVNAQDIDTQKDDNYVYDCSGNLIEDKSDKITINWNPYGKVTDVKQTGKPNFLDYGYDPMQNRALKVSGTGESVKKTYYFRDAQGNVLATYTLKNDVLILEEIDIYGSSRLGLLKPNLQMYPSVSVENKDVEGKKNYELANHLGNVLAVISDRKKGMGSVNGNYAYFDAVTISATDYFPFGMAMPGRTYNTEGYRYTFNGKEDDAEWAKQDYGYRIYDKLSGRFLSIDPLTKKYPELTPYQFASNTPIMASDLDGLEANQETATATLTTATFTTATDKAVQASIAEIETYVNKEATKSVARKLIEKGAERGASYLGNVLKGVAAAPLLTLAFVLMPLDAGQKNPCELCDMNEFLNTPKNSFERFGNPNDWTQQQLNDAKQDLDKGTATPNQKLNAREIAAAQAPKDQESVVVGGHKNANLAGQNHPITNVPFTKDGYPDFSDYLYPNGPNLVIITPNNTRAKDFNAANKAAGHDSTPKGFTWHHHQDRGKMQLVEKEVHKKTGHAGGFSKHKP